jgi:putative transposase
MRKRLQRFYGRQDLHFITCSCHHRLPLLGTPTARDLFAELLGEVRDCYSFSLVGYVVMPEHFHLLMSEPTRGTPSTVMQVLKQRVSRRIRGLASFRDSGQSSPQFWQRRFHDFNVWRRAKITEKLDYMHLNPVTRGLTADPAEWRWSSYGFYSRGDAGLVRIDPD